MTAKKDIEVYLKRLNQDNISKVKNFDCLNENEKLDEFKSKKRKKFKKYSKEINLFLKNEALNEQDKGLNTTHLLMNDKEECIGFISLCTDSIRLESSEREEMGLTYANIPSLKIARLAIDKNYQNQGFGSTLIEFAIGMASQIRDFIGMKFLTVDCYEHRLSYYKNKGFVCNKIQRENRQPDNPMSLRLNIDNYLENMNN